MKRMFCTVSFFLVLAVMIGIAGASLGEANTPALDKIREKGEFLCRIPPQYMPFGMKEGHNYVGYDVDVAELIAKAIGPNVKVKIVEVAWETSVAALQNGDVDCIMSGITETVDRMKAGFFSDPYAITQSVISIRADREDIKSIADLKGKVVGVQAAATPNISIVQSTEGIKEMKQYKTVSQAWLDLEAGRIDAVVEGSPSTGYYLSKNPQLKTVGPAIEGDELYSGIMMRHGEPDLHFLVNDVLRRAKRDGTLDELWEKWWGFERPVF